MKRVRYAIGVGMAPALGLAATAATAATASAAVRPAHGSTAKTVSLQHNGLAPSQCKGHFSKSLPTHSPNGNFFVNLAVKGHCLLFVSAEIRPQSESSINHKHLMRTRVYSAHGAKVFSTETANASESGSILWGQQVGVRGTRACETVFFESHPNKPQYGPMCEKF